MPHPPRNPLTEPQGPQLRRRELLTGLVGIGTAGLAGPLVAAAHPLKVGVIGGGIVGASIAMHLAEAGSRVTVFEKARPAAGATRNSFAWVNAFTDNALIIERFASRVSSRTAIWIGRCR